ncbi:MAG: pyruvate kinase [Actinomycetota bacterium]
MSYALEPWLGDALDAGLSAIRLNSGFGSEELALDWASLIDEQFRQAGVRRRTILDLGGYKARLVQGETLAVSRGERIVLAATGQPAKKQLGVSPPDFLNDLLPGQILVVGDGETLLEVATVSAQRVVAAVRSGDVIEGGRGLSPAGAVWRTGPSTADMNRLALLRDRGLLDAVLVSFVETPDDLRDVRHLLADDGGSIAVIAKLETAAAAADPWEAVRSADEVMVGRGDLALAVGLEEIYRATSRIADACVSAGRPWWIATDCLLGAESGGSPTRAEASDLAGWIERGACGMLLAHETVFGQDPVNAVRWGRTILDRYGGRA